MMNKKKKKCLVIYLTLAVVLCGMVGVAYAVSSTDADEFLTRSEFAVDFARLVKKLDEKEREVLKNIYKYRTTNVKFVTWDTPTKYYNSTNADGGYYNGGNIFPKPKRSGGIATYAWGYASGSGTNKKNGRFTNYSLYRLWNGNYYLTKNIYASNDATSNTTYYYPTVNYAVPIENFPGWYLEVRTCYHANNYISSMCSIIRLDPNAINYPSSSDTLILRFKKDKFVYCGDDVTKLTTTKNTATVSSEYWIHGAGVIEPLLHNKYSNRAATGVQGATYENWIDETTGDYMMTVRGLSRCYAVGYAESDTYDYSYYLANPAITVCKIIPSDNVEYMCGNTYGYYYPKTYSGMYDTHSYIPAAYFIGTGIEGDVYWQYEFVDCENGIKYWHAYRPPALAPLSTYSDKPTSVGIHYSLPIVY